MTTKIGESILDAFPEVLLLLEKAPAAEVGQLIESQITINRRGHARTLLVRLAREQNPKGDIKGFVLTFDDLTEQLADQRKAAWSDVARRIAHEIKNPLTPIQLSAERLRRKYLPQITTDSDSFLRCVDTIMRQVETIGSLVSEFSAFARMPLPKIKHENFSDICFQALHLQQSAHPEITYDIKIPSSPIFLDCDAHQMMQILTNLLQNSAQAISEKNVENTDSLKKQKQKDKLQEKISFYLEETIQSIRLDIFDTGKGFPKIGRERLTEPYYTTRSNGTGLGLAIVKKIMQDHHGSLDLEDRQDEMGAHVILIFPKI